MQRKNFVLVVVPILFFAVFTFCGFYNDPPNASAGLDKAITDRFRMAILNLDSTTLHMTPIG